MKYIALLLLSVGCGIRVELQSVTGPKFKVGDCIDSNEDDILEFTARTPIHPRKILGVGKHNYYYQYGYIKAESSIRILDEFNKKVDCTAAGF